MEEEDPLASAIIGCATRVHAKLGPGFQEMIYRRALAIEMDRAGMHFSGELAQAVYYDGIHIGDRRADFVVERQMVVEIKALADLVEIQHVQAFGYEYAKGLLINFGGKNLQYRLMVSAEEIHCC